MALLASALLSLAVLSLGLAIMASTRQDRGLLARMLAQSAKRLAAARLATDPHLYLAVCLLVPPAMFAIGWLQSPVLAIAGLLVGLLAPRLYLSWLVRVQSRSSESEASRLLQSLLAGLRAGGTYLDAFREARARCVDPWVQQDLDLVIQRFLLDAPMHLSLQEIRARTTTRNLGWVWETLRICTENHLPTHKARNLLLELARTVQFNIQLANEVKSRSAGQRAQVWLLAVLVPGMFVYLRLVSPDLLGVLDQTVLGRYVLFPLAALLEVGGIVLSFRLARIDP
jgi:Flp pilus assembly protein TadB